MQQAQREREAITTKFATAEARLQWQKTQLQIVQQQLKQQLADKQQSAAASVDSAEDHQPIKQERE